MALKGKTDEERIWNYLIGKGLSSAGAAGLMGNLYAESGLNPRNLENLCERLLKEAGRPYCTDASYTAAVDSGKISREEFLHPLPGKQYGYGLAQWTSAGRKAGLYDYVKSKGVSIGDLEAQLEFLFTELGRSYRTVLNVLKNAGAVRAASDTVLKKFEVPADQSEGAMLKRAGYGQVYYNRYAGITASPGNGGHAATEQELRQDFADYAISFLGCRESDGSHRKIIDLYNSRKPLARGYAVKYSDAWCATYVSAMAIGKGLEDIIPLECGCGPYIRLAQAMGIWQEDDAYIPRTGDIVLYDWQDGADYAATDNRGNPDHIGIVVSVSGSTIKVIEGNMNNAVGYRSLQVNGRYIRGYVCPKYSSKAGSSGATAPTQPKPTAPAVQATGGRTYTVKRGDSLWKIAAEQLGSGRRYKEIRSLNGLSSDTIHAGQVLKLPS